MPLYCAMVLKFRKELTGEYEGTKKAACKGRFEEHNLMNDYFLAALPATCILISALSRAAS